MSPQVLLHRWIQPTFALMLLLQVIRVYLNHYHSDANTSAGTAAGTPASPPGSIVIGAGRISIDI
ncbi:predicted protein [Sclerotinia sclerotiorum 1980 UF-70]|uniref:Uncharacterized protein n=2 Tax=Sclerotinia sclerotiorum (strain ATCC 18683 / 1980 / Ss-1) TaxID=665079 RepID=A0A1D9QMD1_SCLS1|nr:predicted protein [Sclerotinia sclerotiorum 1980 UF-70]APA16095.1 hypothetical protein sscle_16g108650 [Sclerotinia sclerotiorum 1980 UF-70]EDN94364.1 predicted protein [Sclerotinia sclerotiorum 1980 UF-70]